MGIKTKATKRKQTVTETTSSGDENIKYGDEWPASPLQEAQCSGSAKDFIYISNEPSIKLVWESNAKVVVDDELDGATLIPSLNRMTLRLVHLLAKWYKIIHEHKNNIENQPPFADMELDLVVCNNFGVPQVEGANKEWPVNIE